MWAILFLQELVAKAQRPPSTARRFLQRAKGSCNVLSDLDFFVNIFNYNFEVIESKYLTLLKWLNNQFSSRFIELYINTEFTEPQINIENFSPIQHQHQRVIFGVLYWKSCHFHAATTSQQGQYFVIKSGCCHQIKCNGFGLLVNISVLLENSNLAPEFGVKEHTNLTSQTIS